KPVRFAMTKRLHVRLLTHFFFFFSSRRRHTRSLRDWSSDVCSSDLWNFALIAKGGAFKLANANQTVAGSASTYDTASKPAVGIEAELRHRAGFALGGEVFYYKNDLVATGVIAKQQVVALMLNGKYYVPVT